MNHFRDVGRRDLWELTIQRKPICELGDESLDDWPKSQVMLKNGRKTELSAVLSFNLKFFCSPICIT